MPRTRRQQRRRLESEAERTQLQEAREAEHHQQAQAEQAVEAPQVDVHEHTAREEDVLEESNRENAREAEDEQEKSLAERGDNVHEREDKDEGEEKHEEGNGGGGGDDEEEEEGNGGGEEGHFLLTDYEKQRERRLKENAAKLAALNLPALASSFGPPIRPQRQCSKKKSNRDDDYMPSNSSDSQDSDSDDNGEEDAGLCHQQDVDGDCNQDRVLQEAIALSLTGTTENGIGSKSKASRTRKGKRQVSDKSDVAKKRKKGRQTRVTTDDIAVIFSLIDEQGNGKFSVTELERMARSHDFIWSKQDMLDMIDFFDTDKDGQLDLPEFQVIFERMNMLKMHVA